MDAKDLRAVAKEMAISLLDNPNIEKVIYNLGHIVSYLESEQEKRQRLERALEKVSDTMETFKEEIWGGKDKRGLEHRLDTIEQRSEKNGKLLRNLLGTIVGLGALEILRLIGQHMK